MLVKAKQKTTKPLQTKPQTKVKEKKITKQKAMQIINLMKRSRWKLTLVELAEKTGVSKSSLSLLLNQYFARKN